MTNTQTGGFSFHESLNAVFLEELFEGDTSYAETVFEDFLNDLPAYWERVQTSYKQRNTDSLATCVHTCKTLFGYVGFTDLQEFCQEFEDKCGSISTEELKKRFTELTEKKERAQEIIEKEFLRLKSFNGSNS